MRENEQILLQLKWAVQALAAPAADQLRLFPGFVCKPDELALDFDNWLVVVRSRNDVALTAHQAASLEAIDSYLASMSGDATVDGSTFWTEEAVRSAAEWERVRWLASDALRAFDWPEDLPPDGRSTYVPAGPGAS